MTFLEAKIFSHVKGIFFTKNAGSFDFYGKEDGWKYLERNFSIKREEVLLPFQEHTCECSFEEENPNPSDAAFTSKGKAVGVLTADCVPILIQVGEKAIGAIHAGWRGLLKEIVKKAIEKASKHYETKPEDFIVSIGPSAQKCCYEVKKDFIEHFKKVGYEKFFEERDGRIYLDIKGIAIKQCGDEGVKRIEVINACTICNESFHSFRKGSKEKMLNIIFFK